MNTPVSLMDDQMVDMAFITQRKRKANAVCNTCSLQTKLELLLN
ncbi:hypothetical protein [Escherichia coli]|nr:hypothetical protein [Escherichia coli]